MIRLRIWQACPTVVQSRQCLVAFVAGPQCCIVSAFRGDAKANWKVQWAARLEMRSQTLACTAASRCLDGNSGITAYLNADGWRHSQLCRDLAHLAHAKGCLVGQSPVPHLP